MLKKKLIKKLYSSPTERNATTTTTTQKKSSGTQSRPCFNFAEEITKEQVKALGRYIINQMVRKLEDKIGERMEE